VLLSGFRHRDVLFAGLAIAAFAIATFGARRSVRRTFSRSRACPPRVAACGALESCEPDTAVPAPNATATPPTLRSAQRKNG